MAMHARHSTTTAPTESSRRRDDTCATRSLAAGRIVPPPCVAGTVSRAAAVLAIAALVFVQRSPQAVAGHSVFHIFTPAVEAGEWGSEALSTFQVGLPREHHENGDEHEAEEHEAEAHGHGSVRAAHEIAIYGGINQHWLSKLALGIERETGGDYQVTSIASENVLRFGPPRHGNLDFAWFTAISAGLDSGASNAIEFGPVVSMTSGRASLVLNPFLEKTFGKNREDGIAFAYAWRATYEVAERLSVGVEGYGEIENIAHAPPGSEQIHRAGPVLYLGHVHGAARHAHAPGAHSSSAHDEHDHDEKHTHQASHASAQGPEWHAEVGVLFGLTEATPDAALKLNIGADF